MAITYEDIQSWSGPEFRKKHKDSILGPEIDAVINKRNEETLGAAQETIRTSEEVEALRAAREQAAEEAQAAERIVLQQEITRMQNLTPDQRVAELAAKRLKEQEDEREEYLAKVAKEKEAARLSRLSSQQRRAEVEAAAEAERLAEEQVVAEAAKAEADRIEAERFAAEKEIADKIAAEKADADKRDLEEKTRIAAEAAQAQPKQKIVQEFQATDADGNPIGRPTHLEADTPEDMYEKMKKSYIEAVRYAERMKKRAETKPTPARVEAPIPVLTDAERLEIQKDLESKDAVKSDLAKLKLEHDDVQKERAKNRVEVEYNRQKEESGRFLQTHPNFYPCVANADILADYIKTNKLDWTAENLERALEDRESSLAPRPTANPSDEELATAQAQAEAAKIEAERVQAEATAKAQADAEAAEVQKRIEQEQAAANTAQAQAPVVSPTPVVEPIPAEIVPVAPNAPTAARKLPAAGVEPGSLHGARSTTVGSKPAGLTKQDIAKMSREEYKKRLRNPEFVKQVNALFASK